MFSNSFNLVNGSYVRVDWPDGKCYFEQENYLITVFDMIKEVYGDYCEAKTRKNKSGKGRR